MSRLLKPKLPLLSFLAAMVLVLFAALSPSPVNATVFTLTDGNSSAQIDPSSQAGMSNWTVDGANYLNQQWFWYRVGNVAEKSIETLTQVSAYQWSTNGGVTNNGLTINYKMGSQFTLGITYILSGSLPGSGSSDMAEIISITNKSGSALNFHFFQYSDFDLSANDSVNRMNANTVLQTSGLLNLIEKSSETSDVPAPNKMELASFPNTLNRLNDLIPTNLNDSPSAGPGNVTWAFEWDKDISPGGSLQISKNKLITVIPTPSTLLLLGSGLLGLVGLRYRRRKAGAKI